MSDTKLKELFEQVLAGEPDHHVQVDDDLARGRSLRKKVIRRRVAGAGVAVLAAAVAAVMVLPSMTILGTDGDVAPAKALDTVGDPIEREMLAAIESVLPDSIETRESRPTFLLGPAHGVQLDLGVSGQEFSLTAYLQESADPPLTNVCSDAMTTQQGWLEPWLECQGGNDSRGRTSVQGWLIDESRVSVVEGGGAAVAVQWDPRVEFAFDAREGGDAAFRQGIQPVAEALWAVGTRHSREELVSGVDLVAVERNWADIDAAVEAELGMGSLRRTLLDTSMPDSITASYFTVDERTEIRVVVWQRKYAYQNVCTAWRPEGCGLPAETVALTSGTPELAFDMSPLDQRGGVSVELSTPAADDDQVRAAVDRIKDLLPEQGGSR